MGGCVNAGRLFYIIGQISRLRCASLEMTPEWITAYGGHRSLGFDFTQGKLQAQCKLIGAGIGGFEQENS